VETQGQTVCNLDEVYMHVYINIYMYIRTELILQESFAVETQGQTVCDLDDVYINIYSYVYVYINICVYVYSH